MKSAKTLVKLLLTASIPLTALCMSYAYSRSYDDQQAEVANSQKYALTLKLHVPRVYNNTQSLGWRRYQLQTITSDMYIGYDKNGNAVSMSFSNTVNKTHKLASGQHVTYDGSLDPDKTVNLAAIGNNKTRVFSTASICFSLIAEPSYNIGKLDEDTSLYITLAGKGQISQGKIKTANGYGAGTLGCGCYDYGHVSPTRVIKWNRVSDEVTDIATVYGTWKMRLVK